MAAPGRGAVFFVGNYFEKSLNAIYCPGPGIFPMLDRVVTSFRLETASPDTLPLRMQAPGRPKT